VDFFLFIVVSFESIEFVFDVAKQLLYLAGVHDAQVLINSVGHLAAKFFEHLGGCSQLANLIDLELFGLSFHFFEENSEVLRDFIRAHEIRGVFAGVKFRAKVFAHLVNLANSSGVIEIRFLGVFEANAAQDFELLISALLVASFLIFSQLDRLHVFPIADSFQWLNRVFEAAHVGGVVNYATDDLNQCYPDLD
jgi:hypothetical protein